MSQNEANDELVIDDGVPVGDLRPHAGFLSIPFLLSVREAIEYPGNMIHIYIYMYVSPVLWILPEVVQQQQTETLNQPVYTAHEPSKARPTSLAAPNVIPNTAG